MKIRQSVGPCMVETDENGDMTIYMPEQNPIGGDDEDA